MPRRVQYEQFGGPEVLAVVEVDEVHAGEGKVRVAVKAVALNPYDFNVRSGQVPMVEPKFPRGIGLEFAGVIDELGPDAIAGDLRYWDGEPIDLGDEVLGWHGLALREQLTVASTAIARKPGSLDWTVAAALPVAVQTATASLASVPVGPGDVVLSNNAAGSVGIMHAQLAIARGAVVIGTSSERNHDLLRSIGVIPTTYGDGLADRVRALAPSPVTAAQDNFGREGVLAALELGVSPERICAIADWKAPAEFGVRTPADLPRAVEALQHVAHAVADGRMTMPIHAVHPIDDVVAAYAELEGRSLSGKVVVTLD